MTTNAGAADMAKAPIGFGRARREGEDLEAINRMFSPEFAIGGSGRAVWQSARRSGCPRG